MGPCAPSLRRVLGTFLWLFPVGAEKEAARVLGGCPGAVEGLSVTVRTLGERQRGPREGSWHPARSLAPLPCPILQGEQEAAGLWAEHPPGRAAPPRPTVPQLSVSPPPQPPIQDATGSGVGFSLVSLLWKGTSL